MARTVFLANSTDDRVKVMPDALSVNFARQLRTHKDSEFAHFAEMNAMLDHEAPDYKE